MTKTFPFDVPESLTGGRKPDKIIHCSVWGDISVDNLARTIIDTWSFQRLHYIHLTGVLYKIFPTATTTVFEHALGSYHVARLFLKKLYTTCPDAFLDFPEVPFYLIPIAALCRWLGSGPFHHLFDTFLERKGHSGVIETPHAHVNDRSCHILENLLTHLSFPFRIPPDDLLFLKTLLSPGKYHHPHIKTWFRTIIVDLEDEYGNPVNFLAIDHVLRCNKAIGLVHGIDFTRILENTRIVENDLCFCTRIEDDLEILNVTKKRLHVTAFEHPRLERFEQNVLRMMNETWIEDSNFREMVAMGVVDDFLEWTDVRLLSVWHSKPSWQTIETRIRIDEGGRNLDYQDCCDGVEGIEEKRRNCASKRSCTKSTPSSTSSASIKWYHRKKPGTVFTK
jgi:HD superfamily phosphohydrolase